MSKSWQTKKLQDLHLTVARRNHNDCPIHISSASDHVLDVIGVARAVDMRVMPCIGLVFDMGGGDGNTTLALLGCLVN